MQTSLYFVHITDADWFILCTYYRCRQTQSIL